MIRNTHTASPIYPFEAWTVSETEFNLDNNFRSESIFALGNGTIGLRGTFEEGLPGSAELGLEGTYINGFYETEIIKYPETAHGFAENGQTMLNVTNGKLIQLYVEGEPFNLRTGTILEYRRTLHLKDALLERFVRWRSPQGNEIELTVQRLVSLENRHLVAIFYTVVPCNFSSEIKIVSTLDGDVKNLTADKDPRRGSGLHGRVLHVESKAVDGTFGLLRQRTEKTKLALVCAMEHTLDTKNQHTISNDSEELSVSVNFTIQAQQNEPIQLSKYLVYVTSQHVPEEQVEATARQVLTNGEQTGFNNLKVAQTAFMDRFWQNADITIDGDVALQQGIRFNMFHLLQSVGRDGKTNIAAKGLTGEGYEGHYFWDTEMYVMPFFLYTAPEINRKLLEYRYHILPFARDRARDLAHPQGALFPWRTIAGEETSAYFPAGTAQYHINADIAFAIMRYVRATGDENFLIEQGAEILFETARVWYDAGAFIPHKGNQFCINEVTGPDEYSAMVNNNCYTNLMARENLRNAAVIALRLQQKAPERYREIATRLKITTDEVESWEIAASEMFIPYDEESKIYPQDDSFLDRAPWDFANTPPENYPLLLHYHPLVIYRHQVCKQADLVLALFLLGEQFTLEEKRRNFEFYEKVTTHDSSLSTAIFSIVAAEIGEKEKAYQYFMNTARLDLDNYHGNVKDGVHIANMAGTWMGVVHGFGGFRVNGEQVRFAPILPPGWNSYSFRLQIKGHHLQVTVYPEWTIYTLLGGDEIKLMDGTVEFTLSSEMSEYICRR